MKVNTSKSKNAESFYIKQSYINSNGKSTPRTIRKLGTLKEFYDKGRTKVSMGELFGIVTAAEERLAEKKKSVAP